MKIFIDNTLIEPAGPVASNFSELCNHVMGMLLVRNLSIGSCEFDGTVVSSLEEAHDLFSRAETCRIASVPLTAALESALGEILRDADKLEADCEMLVTQALLGEPAETADRWYAICEEIKKQIAFLPRLAGLLTQGQMNELVEGPLAELSKVMNELHTAFESGDTLEISDLIELQLLPWLKKMRAFMDNCLQLVAKLPR